MVYVTKNLTFRVFNGVTAAIDGSNLYRCIWVNSGITANFYDVTITNGRSYNPIYYDGAGIFNDGGTVNLYNCVLDDNDGLWSGGAIYNNLGTVRIENSVIKDNNVPTKGGAIYNNQGTVNIVGSSISGNSARNGGAIYSNQGTVTIDNSNINNNSVFDTGDNDGGAIYNENGLLSISGSYIMNNHADNNGGAIYNTGTTTINGSKIYSNSAFNAGGIYNTGNMTITNSEVYSNAAGNGSTGASGGNGGAIYNTGNVIITGSKLYSNAAGNGGNGYNGEDGFTGHIDGYNGHPGGNGGDGGAIYNRGSLSLSDSEIYSNAAGNGGAGGTGGNGHDRGIMLSAGVGGNGGTGGLGGSGGAIYNAGILNLTNSSLYLNMAGNGGFGGLGGSGGDAKGSGLNKGPAANGGVGGQGGTGGNGGAVYYNNGANVSITDSNFNGNHAGNGGNGGTGGNGGASAGSYSNGSGGRGGNAGKGGNGGAIYFNNGTLTVTSNNLISNTQGNGGTGGQGGQPGSGTGSGIVGSNGLAGSSGTGGALYAAYNTFLHFNRIVDNGACDVAAASGISVNAENNWWGTNFQGTNPSNAGRLSDGVDADPWLVLIVTADSPIYNGETSQVTADLTHNSNNQDTSSQGHIPDGTPLTFALTNGPYGNLAAPLEKYTVNGKTSIMFTANDPNAPHTQNVNATVDHQNVTAQILINPRGHVTITKNVNTTIPNYHNLVTFTITVTNNGPNDVSGLQVTDLLPAGLSFDSVNTHGFGTYNSGNGIWDIGILNNGATATLTLVANVTATGSITNWANVTSQTTHDELSFENASVTLNVPSAAYVDIYKEFRDLPWGNVITTANYHGTIYAIVRVQNEGPDPTSLSVLDSLTGINWTGTYYVLSGTVLPLDPNNWIENDSVNTFDGTYWNIPFLSSLMGGNVKLLAIEGIISQTGTVSNFANVTSQGTYAYNGLSNATANLNVPRQADVYVQIIPSKTHLTVGENVIITVKVGNNGPDTAQGVIVSYTVPGGFKFVGVSADMGNIVYNPVTRTVTWNIGDVPVGDPYMYVVLKAVSSGTFKSTAEIIHETTYDPNTKNKASSAAITVQNPKHPVVPDVNPANKTIPLQHTGLPFVGFVLAVLAVFGGLAMPKRKN